MSDAYPPNGRPNSVPPDLEEDELPIHRGEPPRFRRNLFAALGLGVIALAAGAYAVHSLWDRAPRQSTITAERKAPDLPAGAEAVGWSPPDQGQVRRAYADAVRVYAAEGLSGLARQGQTCFSTLNSAPSYATLDYCLALDAIGAEVQRRLSAGAAPDPQSWFGQADVRGLNAARVVLAGQSDASARLIDVRRMAQGLVREADARTRAAAAPPVVPAPTTPVVQPAVPAPAEPAPTVVAEAPRPAVKVVPPAQKAAPRPTVTAQAPAPKAPAVKTPPAPRPTVVAKAPVQKAPAPKAAPPPVREASVRPSFNCRYARSVSERMVCSNSRLADADQRLDSVFRRAMARAENPAALRRQQDRWLAARERAARLDGEQGVLQIYELRIDELREEY